MQHLILKSLCVDNTLTFLKLKTNKAARPDCDSMIHKTVKDLAEGGDFYFFSSAWSCMVLITSLGSCIVNDDVLYESGL